MFSIISKTFFATSISCYLLSGNAFNLDWSKILPFCKELIHYHKILSFSNPVSVSFENIAWKKQKNCFNSLPYRKSLDQSKLKAFTDYETNMAEMVIDLSDGVENIVGKEKMLVTSIFSVFQLFKGPFCQGG